MEVTLHSSGTFTPFDKGVEFKPGTCRYGTSTIKEARENARKFHESLSRVSDEDLNLAQDLERIRYALLNPWVLQYDFGHIELLRKYIQI